MNHRFPYSATLLFSLSITNIPFKKNYAIKVRNYYRLTFYKNNNRKC